MLSAEQIRQAHATSIGDVVAARGIKLRGKIECVGPCPVCGGDDRFAINVRKNIFNCRGCAVGGDPIALVQHLDSVTFTEAVATLAGASVSPRGETRPATIHKPDAEVYVRHQRAKAQTLFRRTVPATGTIVEAYLKSRGIDIPLPATVRFLEPVAGHHPAMLVPFGIPDEIEPEVLGIDIDAVAAVHLTLLRPDGTGKADVKPSKLSIGSPGAMPLVLASMNDLLGLAITEGIEDALSVHQAAGLGAWAAGAAGFMPKLITAIEDLTARECDASPECVTIFADADEAGQRGAQALAESLIARGIEVLINGLAS
jgi:hypothetical protein